MADPTRATVLALLERQRAAWRACADPDAVAADFADDAVFAAPHETYVGPAAIRAAAADFFAYAAKVEIAITHVFIHTAPDTPGVHGVIEWDWTEHPRDGGPPRHAKDAIVFEVHDGQFTQWREYINWRPNG